MSNVSDLLRETATRRPDAVALVEDRDGRRELSWADLDAAVDAVARGLSGRGLRAGHRVAVVMVNRIDLAVAYFGILRGGMVAVPVNPRATAGEIARMLQDCGAQLVLCDEIGVDAVRSACEQVGSRGSGIDDLQVVVDGAKAKRGETSFDTFVAQAPRTDPIAPPDPEARAVILYTSGTSGRPRGAVLTHRALLSNVEQAAAIEPPPLGPDDVVLGLLPLFHVYGLNAVLGQAVRQGARLVLVDGFRPDELLRTIAEEGVTNLPLAPPVIAAWAGRDDLRQALSGVRRVLSGASNLDPELAASFLESSGHHVEQGYGQTETAPVISFTLVGHADRADGQGPTPGTVGRPLPGVEVGIIEDGEREAEPGDPGEIWVRGDNVFSGYWPDGADGPRPDGWYPTGDVGYLDDGGELVLVDRLRELVIVSGFNVYPSEVEEVLGAVDIVREVGVVGVPDERTGEAVVAFVVATSGVTDEEVVRRVTEHATHHLARFKQPSNVIVVHDLPYSATGKVAKGRLRALARSEALGLGAAEA
ncbi:class I adenylate-forming enzyme family protein [Aeromicrobium sp. CTD01-1L150]|uniref:class I adenylate-forming enzyme family protein n=1 Tax=Aeromicrobium sp. CTD01-1L150 TaxID=3341830 RepID=UPI0035BEDF9F